MSNLQVKNISYNYPVLIFESYFCLLTLSRTGRSGSRTSQDVIFDRLTSEFLSIALRKILSRQLFDNTFQFETEKMNQ